MKVPLSYSRVVKCVDSDGKKLSCLPGWLSAGVVSGYGIVFELVCFSVCGAKWIVSCWVVLCCGSAVIREYSPAFESLPSGIQWCLDFVQFKDVSLLRVANFCSNTSRSPPALGMTWRRQY